ncbi:DUF559 domain-containing protein [Rathayibacter tritici]|uniref:DUF559 domain-containing protein n=1 Tax=Rathayibacter tritici TaxID=33888 RepID=A0A160KPZ9_9MICO|nr:DUF559 domain-containing protein [Rathayibacter tritici]AND15566.1 hypothetical protein A6122_0406 [Rathayibacter tritici]PPF28256.1 DUF559 domain-containing protein [Rathayibacter tritici]PPF67686.1 DUF559 domain-containing protein [Rathayibacter tritici]PPG05776.1 DUF559 domain-containing protein [Rathayibacter tritici]PPI16975.1 DUF559 domain-containing protein [Rathayibacter tritici]
MTDLLALLSAAGGIAPSSALTSAGIRRAALEHALSTGRVIRVRRGWYALADAPALELAAVRSGGLLTCVSLLRHLGLWTVERPALHVALGASSVRAVRAGTVGHWRRWPGQGQRSFAQDGIGAAILHLLTCVSEMDAIVTVDSALNTGLLAKEELDALRALAPIGKRALFDLVDGRSQSGLETKTRVSMRRHGVQVRAQVFIPGVGHVDDIIGERLVVESDGYRYHSSLAQFREDRRRDLELARRGYLCLRLDNHQIMDDWARTEDVLLTLIRNREHLWTPAQRRRHNIS